MPLETVSGPLGPFGVKQGHCGSCRVKQGHFGAVWAIKRPLWASKRTQGGPIWHIIMYYTHENCFRATWTIWGHAEPSSGPRGPSEDLWDPPEGHLGPKRALLGSLGAQKRPDTRPKCVITIIPTQSDQLEAVGTKSGPFGAFRSFSPS